MSENEKKSEESKKSRIDEQTAYECGLDIWLRIKLNRCVQSVKEEILKAIPNFMEHYWKEERFESEKDADEFFQWLTITHQVMNHKKLRKILQSQCSYGDLLMDILNEKPLPKHA